MLLAPAPGHPVALEAAIDDLEGAARAVHEVAASVRGLAIAGIGLSMAAVREQALLVSSRIDAAAGHYDQAAAALRDYASTLRQVHARIDLAERAELEALRWLAAPEHAVFEAQRVYAAALDDLDRAADLAIARLVDGWGQLRDWAPGRFTFAAGMALVSSPLLASVIARRIASDVLAPTPRVSLWRDDGTAQQANARARLAALTPGSASDIVEGMALVDRAGSSQKAVVDIAHITGPGGEERWLVTLPSTQDWVFPAGDQPAPNDLDANLAMMLMPPHVRTQYERAVLAAMEQAGIDSGDSVMFAGFSQGGIVAARLASTLHGEYAVGGVLAVGSPIDAFAISPEVPVLSVQHVFDPVHRLDFGQEAAQTGSRVTVWDGPGAAGGGPPLRTGLSAVHNVANYAATTAHHDRDGALTGMFADFVVSHQQVADGWSVTRRQFQFVE